MKILNINKDIEPNDAMKLLIIHNSTCVEPNKEKIKQPCDNQLLYEIIQRKNYDDMVARGYIYFNRVDSYKDDTADGEQPSCDRLRNQQSHFVKAPAFTLENYYDKARSRAYASCFSLKPMEHMKEGYGGENPVCLQFRFADLRKNLNKTISESIIMCNGYPCKQFLNINYGEISYLSKEEYCSDYINPIHYLYMKDDRYKDEKELRVTLSALGIGHYAMNDGNFLSFPKGLELSFDWHKAFEEGWTEELK